MATERILARLYGHFDFLFGLHIYIYLERVMEPIYHGKFERRHPIQMIEDAIEKFIMDEVPFRTIPNSIVRKYFEEVRAERIRPVPRKERKFRFVFRGNEDSLRWNYIEDIPFVLVKKE